MSGVGLDSGVDLPNLAVRGSAGFSLQRPTDYALNQGFKPDESKNVKTFQFSHDGNKLAWSNLSTVQISVLNQGVWTVTCTLDQPKVSALAWSPCSTHLATWELYASINGQELKPNLNIWNGETGEKIRTLYQKKFKGWCPMWNKDESLCSRMVNNEIQFYLDNDFSKVAEKLHFNKVSEFGMSTNPRKSDRDKTHVVVYAPGAKGGPGVCKLFVYPDFGENHVIAQKSFFQADSVDMKWNHQGTCCLLLIQADVDKSNNSYYGNQQLHGINTKGDTFMISMSKAGPIYHAAWSPSGKQFAVVYGAMPSKASLFNEKGDQLFDFGTDHKNMALYNQQGNILMIAGFGNLRGKIDMWNMSGAKPDHISSFEAPDQTDVKWCPDGKLFVTSTCAPRLRLDNGYKIWHYTGTLMYERKIGPPHGPQEELWEVDWQTRPDRMFPSFPVSKQPVQGLQTVQAAPKQAYRPPQARGTGSKTFKLSEYVIEEQCAVIDKKNGVKVIPGMPTRSRTIPGLAPEEEPTSKAALKNKRRRENARNRKDNEEAAVANGGGSGGGGAREDDLQQQPKVSEYQGAAGLLFDPKVEKKKRKINEKLHSIKSLKQQLAEGKVLEKNQMEKISNEKELMQELEKLSIRK
jgi:translation initiation factor 2A